jgi:hypothetical protein
MTVNFGRGTSSPIQQTPIQAPIPVPVPVPVPVPIPVPGPGPEQGWPPLTPPNGPPQVPPPGSGPTVPQLPPGKPGEPAPQDGPSLKPWLIGAGLLGVGVLGAIALHDGARNVQALKATSAAWNSGAMHQGGLQAISDAQLGARFTRGIGLGDYLAVATPGLNRIGTAGQLTAVARGHLDHAELLASSTALQHVAGDSVAVSDPLRRSVLDELVQGRSLPTILGGLDRSAGTARPVFDNPQLARYWDKTSIVARGSRDAGHDVLLGSSVTRPQLRLAPATLEGDGRHAARYELEQTGRSVAGNQLRVARGADLDGRGLADGIGAIQGVGISRLNPAMRQRAVAASGVDQARIDAVGLDRAFGERWSERLQ